MAIEIKYFVHGTTYDNVNGIAAGWNNSDLTEVGIKQTKEAGKILKIENFDLIISSDLQRTIVSTGLLFSNTKIPIIYDNRLRECNYGSLNGKSNRMVNYIDHIDNCFENGESMRNVEKRVRELLLYLKNNYDNIKVAFVSHRAPQLALEVILNNKTWEQAIKEDWRAKGEWKLGWSYYIK